MARARPIPSASATRASTPPRLSPELVRPIIFIAMRLLSSTRTATNSAPQPLAAFKDLPARPDLPVMSGQLALKALKGFKATLAQPALRDHPVQMELTEPTERLVQQVRPVRLGQVLHLTPMKETGATATQLKEQLHFRVLMVQ